MKKEELKEILEKHRKWLRCEDGGERADFREADLREADLREADLRGANLWEADLRGANLWGANLWEANPINAIMYNLQCPEEGAFIGWKKCRDNVLVKLLITEDAKRSSATTRKCRASKVEVLEVVGADKGISKHDGVTEYTKGKILEVDNFDDDRWNECSTGIHFFITRAEAEAY